MQGDSGTVSGGAHGDRPRRVLMVNALELLRVPGSTRSIDATVPVEALGIDDARVSGDVAITVTLEATNDRLLAKGAFSVAYRDTCARCLAPIERPLEVTAFEQYCEAPPPDDPDDEEFLHSFPIENGQIDLAPMVRETLLLALPDAPQCRDDCLGLCPLCGADRNTTSCDCDTAVRDERWAILDQLRDEL